MDITHIFIVNPYAGQKTFADGLRNRLSRIAGFRYFVFNTRYAGHERDLIKTIQNIFQDEKLRFYCCGGSGTMRNMLNGFESLEDAEVAFYPCGLTNDFLKVFGDEQERFHNIEELIDGEVIDVDYISTNHGICLNSISCGVDANVLPRMNDFRMFSTIGKQLPYDLALLYAVFITKPKYVDVMLGDEHMIGRFSELYLGNGHVNGGNMYFDTSSDISDGEGCYCLAAPKRGFGLIRMIMHLIKRDMEKHRKLNRCGYSGGISFKSLDGELLPVSQDGELIDGFSEWEAHIVKKGLHLVVPKGARAHE